MNPVPRIRDNDNRQQKPAGKTAPVLNFRDGSWVGSFHAMASPCEIILAGVSLNQAQVCLQMVAREAWRIEQKFSRYRSDSVLSKINNAGGKPVEVDEETANLLDYADQCYQLSDGLFDVTSGVLRKNWKFNGGDQLPERNEIEQTLTHIGWPKATWKRPEIVLPDGMEIDFGGIGKEYAVDKALQLVQRTLQPGPTEKSEQRDYGVLINFGGDLACYGRPPNGEYWQVGIESLARHQEIESDGILRLHCGAIATSGDTHRYLLKNGKRYSHILNPVTGWPVEQAPHSITVIAPTCTLAGMLATFAMLQGNQAKDFLDAQADIRYYIQS
ncbi:MAG: FAD:protein FMN transferase [Pseudomonadales bacterium]|nr:FAD:protein FMN transferase [Pseudomonadales bacterium]